MRVFIQDLTYIEKGLKCRGKKFTSPKCLKVRFPNLDSSRTILAEKYLDESRFGKQYYPLLG